MKDKQEVGIIRTKEYFRRIELIEPEIDKLQELMKEGMWIKAYEQIQWIDDLVSDMRTVCSLKLDTNIYNGLKYY